eukprot:gb/GECG01016308.1/.p1 GENE.gb/GECG01016308.1/~~gb/GECG01016308.1/.p1  ORF type:complete len:1453 (+),score=299.33 gb/GECG01016308.1/:1-4359(+)
MKDMNGTEGDIPSVAPEGTIYDDDYVIRIPLYNQEEGKPGQEEGEVEEEEEGEEDTDKLLQRKKQVEEREAKLPNLEISQQEVLQMKPQEIIQILKEEAAPVKSWRDIMVAYSRNKEWSKVEEIAEAACKTWNESPRWQKDKVAQTEYASLLVARFAGLIYSVSSPQMLNKPSMRAQVVRATNKAQDVLSQVQSTASTSTLTKAAAGLHYLLKAQQEALDEASAADPDRQTLNLARKEFSDAAQTHSRYVQDLRRRYTLGDDECPVHIPGRTHIAATVGEACVAYQQGNYVLARRLFAEAIRAHPRAPASLRVALGHCLYKLGHIEVAKKAFQRALQLEPNNSNALTGLAILIEHYHGEQTPSIEKQARLVRRSRALLQRAVEVNKDCSMAQNHLSEHYFHQYAPLRPQGESASAEEPVTASVRNLQYRVTFSAACAQVKPGIILRLFNGRKNYYVEVLQCIDSRNVLLTFPFGGENGDDYAVYLRDVKMPLRLAQRAVECSANNKVKAESHFLAARAHHALGQYIDAAAEYQKCMSLRENFYPCLFGLAKCFIYQKKEMEAEKILKDLAKAQPDNGDVHCLMGAIYWQRSKLLGANESAELPQELLQDCAVELSQQERSKKEERNKDFLSSGLPKPSTNELLSYLTHKALREAEEATEVSPNDVRTWLLFGEIQQDMPNPKRVKKAYAAYDKTIRVLHANGQGTPHSLWNNIAVLRARQGDLADANRLFDMALKRVAALVLPDGSVPQMTDLLPENVRLHPTCVCITFNIARLREMEGKLEEAEMLFKMIVGKYSSYVDALLRLASLSMQQRDIRVAEGWIKRILRVTAQSENSDAGERKRAGDRAAALCLYGQLKELQEDFKGATSHYDAVLGLPHHSSDSYALLAQANLKFRELYRFGLISLGGDASLDGKIGSAHEDVLRRAFADYKDVLRRESGNIFAANGLGCILAEQGRVEYARDVFAHVREADQDVRPATVNLAHCFLVNGNAQHAIQLYKKALKKFYGGGGGSAVAVTTGDKSASAGPTSGEDLLMAGSSRSLISERISVMCCLARAYTEVKKHQEAIDVLKSALIMQPDNMQLWYNMAYARGEEALRILGLPPTERELWQVERGSMHLQYALRLFKKLQDYLDERIANDSELQGSDANRENKKKIMEKIGFSPSSVKRFIAHCEKFLGEAEKHLRDARLREEKKRQEEAKRAAELEQAKRTKEEEKRLREEEERLRRENEQAKAKELATKLADLREQWEQQEANKKEAEKNKRKLSKAAAKRKEIDNSVEKLDEIDSDEDLSGPVMLESRRVNFRQAARESGLDTSQNEAELLQQLFGEDPDDEEAAAGENGQHGSGGAETNGDITADEIAGLFHVETHDQGGDEEDALREIFGEGDDSDEENLDGAGDAEYDETQDHEDDAEASASSSANKRAAPDDYVDEEGNNKKRAKHVVEGDEDEDE